MGDLKNMVESKIFPIGPDAPWESKQYKLLLSLLQNDSYFPGEFDLKKLNEEDEDQRNLKEFAEERNRLHQWIVENKYEEVKKYTSEMKSRYYYNSENRSAASVALRCRNFNVYAYLRSINVNLASDESGEKDELSDAEKFELKDTMLRYFPSSKNSHVYYIISKTKIKTNSPNKLEDRDEVIKDYLYTLNQIEDVSIILKVIECAENLELVLDLDDENVQGVCPPATTAEKGITFTNLCTIYVAAGRERVEVLGTLAHELTHMAMELIFKNDTNPYYKSDIDTTTEFRDIKNSVYRKICTMNDEMARTLEGAFMASYKSSGCVESELIARVPQVLAHGGREWLENHVPELLNFYRNRVIPECEKFIMENPLLKARNLNREMNESEGEIRRLRKCDLFFSDISNIKIILNKPDKRVFALITDYTWLGLLRVLQGMYGVGYVDFFDSFLVFKLENVMKNFKDVKYLFNSEATEILVIECTDNLRKRTKILQNIQNLIEIVKKKTGKKIIFVMKENDYKYFMEIVEKTDATGLLEKKEDEDISLFELDGPSLRKILGKTISFQGTEVTLCKLIGRDENSLKGLNAAIVQELLQNKEIEVAPKAFGISSLEGAYADIVLKINVDSFISEIKNSSGVFMIQAKDGSNREKEIIELLGKHFDESDVHELKDSEEETMRNKKIILTDDKMTDDKFRKFCSYQSDMKIYWINTTIEQNKLALILIKIYNPDFYFTRKFLNFEKVIIKKDIYNEKSSDALIVVSDKNYQRPAKWFQWLPLEKAKLRFEELSKLKRNVHLVEEENDRLVWIKSKGSLTFLRKWIDEDLSVKTKTDEEDLARIIENEKVVIFADEPGMGKSTSLTKLLEMGKNFAKAHWFMRINLRDHLSSIKNINENLNMNDVTAFFKEIDPSLQKGIGKIFLESALYFNKSFNKQLLIAFDGFDELLDTTDRDKIVALFVFLKNETKCKVWVTTRLHFKETLEDELLTFAIRFVPVGDKSKWKFMKKYLGSRLNLILNRDAFSEIFEGGTRIRKNSILGEFANHFIDKTKSIFKGDVENFIGTPLQLHLLLEGSLKFFLDWVENPEGCQDFSYLGSNLLEVYQGFFERKYKILFTKRDILEQTLKLFIRDSIEKYHEELARSLLLNEKRSTTVSDYMSFILSLGISKMTDQNIEFCHFTFREYFFAQWVFKNLSNHQDNSSFKKAANLFWESILVKNEYQLIRSFMSGYFREAEEGTLLEFRGELSGVRCWKSKSTDMCGFCVAIQENHDYLLEFLFSVKFVHFDVINILLHEQFCKRRILFLAVEKQNDFALKLIFELASKYDPSDQYKLLSIVSEYGGTILHLAVKEKNDSALNRIINMASNLSLNQRFQFLSLVNNYGSTALHLATERKNDTALEKILDIASKLSTDLNYKLLSNTNKLKETALHLAVLEINDFALCQIMEYTSRLCLDLQYQLLNITNERGETVLHLAIKEKNDLVLDLFIEMMSKYTVYQRYNLETMASNYGETVLELAEKAKNHLKKESYSFLLEVAWKNYAKINSVNLKLTKAKYVPVGKSVWKMISPGSVDDSCPEDRVVYICKNCKVEIKDGDDCFYVIRPVRSFEFKCNSVNHCSQYLRITPSFPFKEKLSNLSEQSEKMNILILGSSGVGKSTWINSLTNYFKYKTFEEAKGGVVCAIPASFTINCDTGKKVVKQLVRIGKPNENETISEFGKSTTSSPRTYILNYGKIIRLIDTPGIGGTRDDEDQNREHMKKIIDHVSFLDELHGICILLPVNTRRIDAGLRFCISELFNKLNKKLARNIIFCFTNSRSTMFAVGDAATSLDNFLKELNINNMVSLTKETMFFLDNEAFEYLCTMKYKNRLKDDEKNCKLSWNISAAETTRLFECIGKLEPYPVVITTTLWNGRYKIGNLMKPLADITQTIQMNLALLAEEERRMRNNNASLEELVKKMHIPQIVSVPICLSDPITICTSRKCIAYQRLKRLNITTMNYVQICHSGCSLENVMAETYPKEVLRKCTIFNVDPNREKCCIEKCGCSLDSHMLITYTQKREEKQVVNTTIEDEIDYKKNDSARLEEYKQKLELMTEEYKEEQNVIMHACLKFGAFLRKNSTTPYNDAFKDYLKFLIQQEKNIVNKTETDDLIIQNLNDVMARYEEEVQALEESIQHGESFENVTLQDIADLEQKLYGLKLTGKQIKNNMEVSKVSNKEAKRYSEKALASKESYIFLYIVIIITVLACYYFG